MQGGDLAPGLEYDLLWMAFKPGNFLYGKTKNIEMAYRLVSIAKNSNQNAKDHMTWTLEMEDIAYDGKVRGHVRSKHSVECYHGYKPFTALSVAIEQTNRTAWCCSFVRYKQLLACLFPS